MCPRRGNDPASGHPRAHQPPLGRGTSPPAWDGRLDAPGQRRRHLPSSAWTRRREVKQGKSGGSVGTTDQGKGKGRSVVRPMGTVAYRGKGQGKGKGRGEGRLGQGGRGRSKGGEKLMGTTAYGGKGSKGRAANGDRPVGAASCRRDHHTMASCQNPPCAPWRHAKPPPCTVTAPWLAPQSAPLPHKVRRRERFTAHSRDVTGPQPQSLQSPSSSSPIFRHWSSLAGTRRAINNVIARNKHAWEDTQTIADPTTRAPPLRGESSPACWTPAQSRLSVPEGTRGAPGEPGVHCCRYPTSCCCGPPEGR